MGSDTREVAELPRLWFEGTRIERDHAHRLPHVLIAPRSFGIFIPPA